jgi:hypothetical protein
MIYLIYLVMTALQLVVTLAVYPLAPAIAALCRADGTLPAWLAWAGTFDATLDAGWQGGYFAHSEATPTGLSLWWFRVRWLWRNPAYSFCYYSLGIPFDPAQWKVLHYSVSGTDTTFIATNGRYFNIELGWSWLQLKVGWKAMNYFDATTGTFKSTPWGPLMRTMICATIIPW